VEEAQRQAALAVRLVHEGNTLPSALASVAPPAGAQPSIGGRRALVQELAYGTLRYWGTLNALTGKLARKPFTDPVLAALVAVALYQLDHTRAPPFAIVDHAVNAAAKIARPAAKSLVNALLRRYLREREALNLAIRADDVARWSHPQWWIERVRAEYPDDWESILAAGNERPPLSLRVNTTTTTREALLAACTAAEIGAVAAGDFGVVIDPPRPVAELPGFAEGWFAVQDLGAQLAAPLLRVEPGMHVLDACAAPGGKTTHLAEMDDVDIVALDSDKERVSRVYDNLQRLRLDKRGARIVTGDAVRQQRGGMAGHSHASWSMSRARHRAWSAVIPTASGCAERAI
jgi:16S rRNA (cytosine967-C5)-methyltransferase